MLAQILKAPIFRALYFLIFLVLGLWTLFKGELNVRHVKEPIKGVPARIIGFLFCVWSITWACDAFGLISPVYKDISMYVIIISFASSIIMVLLFGFINMFKQ